MSTLALFGYICAALLVQLVIGVGIGVARMRGGTSVSSAVVSRDSPAASEAAWSGWRDFRVSRRVPEDISGSQCSFHLQPVDRVPLPAFKPGQFLTFSLALTDGAEESSTSPRAVTRCYSLSDMPDADAYRVTVKRAPPPRGHPEWPPGLASNHFHDRVAVGDRLRVKAPAGNFHIDGERSVPAVFIACGIGITPIMSMLRWSIQAQPERSRQLFYGVRNSSDHAFKLPLDAMAAAPGTLRSTIAYSDPLGVDVAGADYQVAGRITLDLLRRTLAPVRHQFYVCGPPGMMQDIVPGLRAWGVAESDIHFEAFGPATVRSANADRAGTPAASARSIEVRFNRTGRTLTWNGEDDNLLEFAERNGLAVDSGCRSGSCGSCETRVISGTVGYLDTPDHPIPDGYCLLCVGSPASALVLDA